MGLLTILKKMKQEERELRILILGLDNAGKTTIAKALLGQDAQHRDQIEPTLGFQIHTLEYQDYQIHLWDIGGQTSIRSYWRNYFEQTDGIVWVIDSTDIRRMDLVRTELVKVLQQEKLAGASLLVWANKQDMRKSGDHESTTQVLSASEIQQALDLDAMCDYGNSRHYHIQGCSAKTTEGLLEGMDWLIDDIGNRIFSLS